MELIIKCELLHYQLQKVYLADHQVTETSEEYSTFQNHSDPEQLGFLFVRDYVPYVDETPIFEEDFSPTENDDQQ
jgi:hypothetical protein